jgi:hypothetical protein
MPEKGNMPDAIERYIENVLIRADLSVDDERIVRAELNEHLHNLLAGKPAADPKEVYAMIENEFGNAGAIGKSIAAAKGRMRTYFKKQMRKLPLKLAAVIVLAFTVRYAVAQPFYVPSNAAAPQIPQGSRVLVYKLTRSFVPGDVVVFTADAVHQVGIVVSVQEDNLVVQKHGVEKFTVPLDQVVGRVILNTR